jgi:hypothetical protein
MYVGGTDRDVAFCFMYAGSLAAGFSLHAAMIGT